MTWTTYESPFGPLTLVAGEAGLRALHFPERVPALDLADHDPDALREVCEQLEQYFAGEREAFDVELDLSGTPLRRRVWRALRMLPYGDITTYGALARELGVGVAATAHATFCAAVGRDPVTSVGESPTPSSRASAPYVVMSP